MNKTKVALIGVGALIGAASASTNSAELLESTLQENSAYQLELANGTTNVLNITKYLENAETGELMPQVYNVVFTNQLRNADATGDEVKYFSWVKDSVNGGYDLVAGTSGSHDLKVGLGEDVYVGQSGGNGGAINIDVTEDVDKLAGTFVGNSAQNGGAIFNRGDVAVVEGDFIGNSANTYGGALYNFGSITAVDGDFIGNSAGTRGGAIYNDKTIDSISGDFVGNSSGEYGGAIHNSGTIDSITGDFSENSTGNRGGAISNEDGSIGSITGDFVENSVGLYGGAIFNNSGTIGSINGNFIGNSASTGGAIENFIGVVGTITGDFIGNFADDYGGAIANAGNLGLLAKDGSVEFTGNIAGTGDSQRFEAIYAGFDGIASKINMNAYGQNKIVVNDAISGDDNVFYQVININNGLAGDNSKIDAAGKSFGVVEFNNKVQNHTVNVVGGTLKAGSYKGGVVDLGSGKTITTQNAIAQFINTDVKVAKDAKLLIGADVNGNSSVSFDADSSLTLENGGILAFEGNSSVDISGAFAADDATLLLEFSDYVAGLEDGKTVELDWTIATFDDASAASDALAGFSEFGNDLGIARGDESSEGLWFDVVQNGNELKVVGVIPEPATIGLLGLMSGALFAIRRRFC